MIKITLAAAFLAATLTPALAQTQTPYDRVYHDNDQLNELLKSRDPNMWSSTVSGNFIHYWRNSDGRNILCSIRDMDAYQRVGINPDKACFITDPGRGPGKVGDIASPGE